MAHHWSAARTEGALVACAPPDCDRETDLPETCVLGYD